MLYGCIEKPECMFIYMITTRGMRCFKKCCVPVRENYTSINVQVQNISGVLNFKAQNIPGMLNVRTQNIPGMLKC